jgi:hypothetical protein
MSMLDEELVQKGSDGSTAVSATTNARKIKVSFLTELNSDSADRRLFTRELDEELGNCHDNCFSS